MQGGEERDHNYEACVICQPSASILWRLRGRSISIGTIGLIKAVNTFKPDRGIRLATYASRCIENTILS